MFGFDVQKVCENLNYRHRMAQYAGRASVALHTQVLSCDALVCDIQCSLESVHHRPRKQGVSKPTSFPAGIKDCGSPLILLCIN